MPAQTRKRILELAGTIRNTEESIDLRYEASVRFNDIIIQERDSFKQLLANDDVKYCRDALVSVLLDERFPHQKKGDVVTSICELSKIGFPTDDQILPNLSIDAKSGQQHTRALNWETKLQMLKCCAHTIGKSYALYGLDIPKLFSDAFKECVARPSIQSIALEVFCECTADFLGVEDQGRREVLLKLLLLLPKFVDIASFVSPTSVKVIGIVALSRLIVELWSRRALIVEPARALFATFSAPKNSLSVALVGRRDTGKTTFLNAIRGYRNADAGVAVVDLTSPTKEVAVHTDYSALLRVKYDAVFRDLPGLETGLVAHRYSRKQGLLSDSCLLLFVGAYISEMDISLAREPRKLFYMENVAKQSAPELVTLPFFFISAHTVHALMTNTLLENSAYVLDELKLLDFIRQHSTGRCGQ